MNKGNPKPENDDEAVALDGGLFAKRRTDKLVWSRQMIEQPSRGELTTMLSLIKVASMIAVSSVVISVAFLAILYGMAGPHDLLWLRITTCAVFFIGLSIFVAWAASDEEDEFL